MQIRPTGLQNSQSINLNTNRVDASNQSVNQAPVDQLDLSAEAQMLSGGEIRAELVAQVKADIANGVYETEAKMDAAVDRLLDEIG